MNVAERLRAHAVARPDKPALHVPARRGADGRWEYAALSYRAIDSLSDAYARGFAKLGIGRGTKTILMVRPSVDLFAIAFALFKLGAVPVVVDPGMGVRRMLHCYETAGADAFIGIPIAHAVRALFPRSFASLKRVVTVGRRLGWGGATLAQIAEPSEELLPIAKTEDADLLMINFTTGSTGPAKGVEYTHGAADAMLRAIAAAFGEGPDDVSLATLPLFGFFDLLLGATAVLPPMDPTKPALADADAMIDAIDRFHATTMFASPAFLRRVGEHALAQGRVLESLRSVVAGGAPISPRIALLFTQVLPPDARMHATYGATEALPIATIESRALLASRAATTKGGLGTCVGRPALDAEVRILRIDDGPIAAMTDDALAARGEVGEIAIAGSVVSRRYHDDARSNSLHKIDDRDRVWHRTGDLGRVDDDGALWFCGRKSERVTTTRGALFTVAWEGVFEGHASVRRAALVGIGDAGEQQPVLWIEIVPGERDRKRVRRELDAMAKARGLVLRAILFHPSFPVDIRHNAKIDRAALATAAARGLSRGVPWARLVPIAGWLFILYGLLVPLGPALRVAWLVDVFLSVVVHGAQLAVALPIATRAGYSRARAIALTFLFGATFWKSLGARR